MNTSFNVSWLLLSLPSPSGTGSSGLTSEEIIVTPYPDWFNKIRLEWSVPQAFGNCKFNIYFSPTEDGPFNRLTAEPIQSTFLDDSSTKEYSKLHNGFYQVEALLLGNSGEITNVFKSKPVSWKAYQRRWVEIRAIEIQRREYFLLSKFAGVKSFLFRKKQYGQRCSTCWDVASEKVTNDYCPTCMGTSFEGGYWPHAELYLQYEVTPNERTRTYFGILEANQVGAWTISMPSLECGDILIRSGDWNAYRIDRVITTELQANVVRQMISLSQLGRKNIENSLKNRLPETYWKN